MSKLTEVFLIKEAEDPAGLYGGYDTTGMGGQTPAPGPGFQGNEMLFDPKHWKELDGDSPEARAARTGPHVGGHDYLYVPLTPQATAWAKKRRLF